MHSNIKLCPELCELNSRLAEWSHPGRTGYDRCPECGSGVRIDDEWRAIVCVRDGARYSNATPCPWYIYLSDESRPYVVPDYWCQHIETAHLLIELRNRNYAWVLKGESDRSGACEIRDRYGTLVSNATWWYGPMEALCLAIDQMIRKMS